MFPTITSPVWSPMRVRNLSFPSRAQAFERLNPRFRHSSAERQAQRAWSSRSTGAPQNAMIESPMYLSSVPLFSWIAPDMAEKYSYSRPSSSSGSRFSDIPVKFSMSEKKIVTVLFSPPILASLSSCMRILTTSAGTYFLKFVSPFFMPSKESTMPAISAMLVRMPPSSVMTKRFISFISCERSFIGFDMTAETKIEMMTAKRITMKEMRRTTLLFR